MTEPRLAETSSRAARIQDALNNIGSWLLDVVSVDPGWSEMVLDVKPLAGQIFVRVREFRNGEEFIGTIGPLKDGSPIIAEVRKLQRAAYDGNRGTWFTASIVVAATGWPNPQFSVGASYNRDDEPASWKNEGTLTATDVREHLAEFPVMLRVSRHGLVSVWRAVPATLPLHHCLRASMRFRTPTWLLLWRPSATTCRSEPSLTWFVRCLVATFYLMRPAPC